jgi:hypothetical protein
VIAEVTALIDTAAVAHSAVDAAKLAAASQHRSVTLVALLYRHVPAISGGTVWDLLVAVRLESSRQLLLGVVGVFCCTALQLCLGCV